MSISLTLMRIFFIFGLLFTIEAYGSNTPPTVVKRDKTQSFLTLADIHFDPFLSCHQKPCPLIQKLQESSTEQWKELFEHYDSSAIAYGKDSNYTLLKFSLAAAKKEAKAARIQFVIVIGDFLAHHYDKKYFKYSGDKTRKGYISFVDKTMVFLGKELNKTFPQADIYWVIGNNDSYQDDYSVEPEGQFFKDLSKIESSLIKTKKNKIELEHNFPRAGYYALNAPNQPALRLIFLNSVLFSKKVKGRNLDQVAKEQLDWLHNELVQASKNHQKVLIAMHIPTGIDVYTSLFIPFGLTEFWKPVYSQRFLDEIREASDELMGVFTAHIHADAFQILSDGSHKAIPFTGSPSISPIFGNNPGFKIYTYAIPRLRLVDFVTYYYSLNNTNIWEKEYDFDEVYQLEHSDGELINGMLHLQPKGALANHYKAFYAVSSNSHLIAKYTDKWLPYYWCAIRGLTLTEYKGCLSSFLHSR